MATLTFDVSATNVDVALGLVITFDNEIIADIVPGIIASTITHDFDDSVDGEHRLEITLKNKQPNHTQLDADGNIVRDAVLELSKFTLESIDITQVMYNLAKYNHDFNGTAEPVQTVFYGTMGCNGTVSLSITSPVYVWLLEAM